MMLIDITGEKFGLLTAIEPVKLDRYKYRVWKCQCECGKIIFVRGGNLRSGNNTSCGDPKHRKRLGPKINLTGKQFGKLTVIRDIEVNGQTRWLCRCECGKEVKLRGGNLTGKNNTSCGCRKKNGHHSTQWSGYGEISGFVWAKLKLGARKRDLPVEISVQYAWEKFLEQRRLCALSGLPITFSETAILDRTGHTTASLDRIDSTKGYIVGNIQWVHRDINRLKWDLPEDRFIELCRIVTEYQNQVVAQALSMTNG
jgi:hypothetical protein